MKLSSLRPLLPMIALMLCAMTLAVHAHGRDGDDMVNIGHDSHLPPGQSADSVVSIFGNSSSEGNAGNVVSVLGNTNVTGTVTEAAVAVLGNVYIDGSVKGDAVAVLGNMTLGPHAEIGGNVVTVGGDLQRDPAAVVHGSEENIFSGLVGNIDWLHSWIQHCFLYLRPLAVAPGLSWAWSLALACLALYVGIALLFRAGITECVRTLETQPGRTILAAFITVLLTPLLLALLFVTIIGIAAVPFVVLGLFCAGLFGKAVTLAWLGGRVLGPRATGSMSHPAVAVLIGGAIVLLLYLVPVLGFLVYNLLGLIGLGAVVLTLILAFRSHRAVNGAGSNPAPAAATANQTAEPAQTTEPAQSATASATAASPPPAAAPSPITADLPRAGFWVRMAALLLDILLVGIATNFLNHIFHLHILLLAAYGAVMWKLRGTTVGGIVFDLQVVRLDGRAIDWETAVVRALGCFLSVAVAGLGFFWIAFDDAKQAWHDKIAGTVVVRVPKGRPLV